jgi:hypothetical protein
MSHCYGVRDKCCSRGDVCPNLIGLGDPVWFREFGGRPREPAQTCKSFIRCGRFSAMAGLSFAMPPRDCAISGARNRVPGKRLPWVGSGRRTSPASLSESAVLYHGNGWRTTAIRLIGRFKMCSRFRNLGYARTPTSSTRHHAQSRA